MIPNWLANYLDEEGAKQIEASVQQAEKKTRGEIVPMIVRRSATVGHIPIVIFSIGLLFYFISGVYDYSHENFEYSWAVTFAWAVVLVPISRLASRSPKVQRLFVNPMDRSGQAQMRAMNEFYYSGLNKTVGSTGILLFVSLEDHQAVVLADKNISEKLPAETWNTVVQTLLQGAKKKNLASGFSDSIDMCGEILKEHFPILPDDVDELPNHLVIKE